MAAAEDTKKDADVKATKVRARRDRAATPAPPRPQPMYGKNGREHHERQLATPA